MRRLAMIMLALCAMGAVLAQDEATLMLSKSLVAIKITDPERQVTAFGPLLLYLDGLAVGRLPAKEGAPASVSQTVREGASKLTNIPGVDPKGDFWMVIMPAPPAPEEAAPKPEEAAPEPGNPPAAEPGKDAEKEPRPKPPTYLVAPLADPAAFGEFLKGHPEANGAVSGKLGLLPMSPNLPKYTAVALDIESVTRRDVLALVQVSSLDMSRIEGVPAALEGFLGPVVSYFEELHKNVLRAEAGLGMDGADLSIEGNVLPVPGSPFETQLAEAGNSALALEYAGYLPENLAFAGASGPELKGAPGFSSMALRVGFGLLGMFLTEDRHDALLDSVEGLVAQCSQGRALGITAPPTKGPGEATAVAVYHVTGQQEAAAVVSRFVDEFQLARDSFMGGMASELVVIKMTPGAEKIGDVPIDLYQVSAKAPPAEEGGKGEQPALAAYEAELRIAYIGDKMLFTAGARGKAEMAALAPRVKQKQAVFTKSARFQAAMAAMPKTVHGFGMYATLDLARAAINTVIKDEKERESALQFLSIFPPQQAPVLAYQDVQGNRLHSEVRLSAEQMNFLFSCVKAMMEFGGKGLGKAAGEGK